MTKGFTLIFDLFLYIENLFTFQYGGIKLKNMINRNKDIRDLHSSMVGLNLTKNANFRFVNDLHSSMVGLNFPHRKPPKPQNLIYIPVWWD